MPAAPLLLAALLPAAPPAVWPRHVVDAGSRGADGVRLADVDGDGRADIVTPWEEGGEVRVALRPAGNPAGPWPSVTVGRVAAPEDAVAVDLDGDGRLEILSGSEGAGGRLSVHHLVAPDADPRDAANWATVPLGDSVGRQKYMFAVPWPAAHGGGFLAAGKDQGAAVERWRPTGEPGDWAAWRGEPLRPVGWAMSLRAEDMDGDGDPDLLLSDRKGPRRGVVWLEYEPESAAWAEHAVGGAEREPMFLTTHDLDGDGDRDIAAAAAGAGLILFERLDATGDRWRARTIPLPNSAGTAKAVAAHRTAGGTELFVTCEHAAGRCSVVRFAFAPGADVWADVPAADCPAGTVGVKFDLAELLDLDGDGDPDLLTCEERAGLGVIWYERPGP